MSTNVQIGIVARLFDSPGWLRGTSYDLALIFGTFLLALASGLIVVWQPWLFFPVLLADLWLLGYHHVIATFTRLSFDRESLKENRFLVFYLPFLVLAATVTLAITFGAWMIASIYLYWQWFHYSRQSWGISRVYERKSGGLVDDNPLFSQLCFYLVPIYGILYRSWQAPETFILNEVRVIPMPELAVDIVGIAALISILAWLWTRLQAWRQGRLAIAHSAFMASHIAVFLIGYRLIEDITYGWVVLNVWHNAQYLLFVWLFNANKFKDGIDEKSPFLSGISQSNAKWRYFLSCFALSTVIYLVLDATSSAIESSAWWSTDYFNLAIAAPVTVIIFQTINFHHYIVDSRIWKVRSKPIQETLGLSKS